MFFQPYLSWADQIWREGPFVLTHKSSELKKKKNFFERVCNCLHLNLVPAKKLKEDRNLFSCSWYRFQYHPDLFQPSEEKKYNEREEKGGSHFSCVSWRCGGGGGWGGGDKSKKRSVLN